MSCVLSLPKLDRPQRAAYSQRRQRVAVGIPVEIAIGFAIGIAALHLYYHSFTWMFVWPRLRGRWYPYHPVAWDDPCGVPFAGLDNLLAAYALEKPEAAESEIERLFTSYPSQRTAALRARATLLARQASVVGDLTRLDEIAAELPEGELLLPVLTPLSDEGDCFEMTKPELRNTER